MPNRALFGSGDRREICDGLLETFRRRVVGYVTLVYVGRDEVSRREEEDIVEFGSGVRGGESY